MNTQQLLLFDITNFELVLKGSDTDELTHMAEVPHEQSEPDREGSSTVTALF